MSNFIWPPERKVTHTHLQELEISLLKHIRDQAEDTSKLIDRVKKLEQEHDELVSIVKKIVMILEKQAGLKIF
jgi:hypothetical protein